VPEEHNIKTQNEDDLDDSKIILRRDIRRAILYSIAVTALTLASSLIVTVSSGSEARILLSGMLPSIRFLSSAGMTASATTLALMLALVGFGQGTNGKLKPLHFDRVEQIARWNLIVFIAASSLLLFITIPLSESQEVPNNWYRILYYVILIYSGGLIGALTFVVILLFQAIVSLIDLLHPTRKSDLIIESNPKNKIELPKSSGPSSQQ
jgi:hypothetical protein